jgi:hypothetical protein
VEILLKVPHDLADETLEGELADEQIRGLLVAADLAERHRARTVAVGLRNPTARRLRLARRLDCELLAGRLAAGGLARGLLGASHLQHGPNTQHGADNENEASAVVP